MFPQSGDALALFPIVFVQHHDPLSLSWKSAGLWPVLLILRARSIAARAPE
jgi:hypothetical protein